MAVSKVHDNLDEENDKLNIIKNYKTLLNWFRSYHCNDCFTNPSHSNSNSHKNAPPLLYENPDLLKSVLDFCKDNISRLTVDLIHDHIINEIIPQAVEIYQKDSNNPNYTKEDLFLKYWLKTLNPKTVYNWMICLGFKHEPHQKSYYVDNHESEENVFYRNSFVKRYFEYELSCHR